MAKKKGKSSKASVRRDDRETSALMGNPVWRAFAAKEPISKGAQTTIGLAARKSLYALSNGQGAHGHFKELFVTANVGAYLAEQGIGQEFMVDFHA